MLRQCGVLPDTSVLSTELIFLIGHRKLLKLTFGAFAALHFTLETSPSETLHDGQLTKST